MGNWTGLAAAVIVVLLGQLAGIWLWRRRSARARRPALLAAAAAASLLLAA
ncbi:MAG TPA: hypothetical protein VFX49_06815 [Chloroflexota bacterium]|nr:hypothetical protein [Chloroflexota bacterium]